MELTFKKVDGNSPQYYLLLAVLAAFVLMGSISVYLMITRGVYLSGMTNRVPWGLQIVMAVFYIGLSAGSLP